MLDGLHFEAKMFFALAISLSFSHDPKLLKSIIHQNSTSFVGEILPVLSIVGSDRTGSRPDRTGAITILNQDVHVKWGVDYESEVKKMI